MQQERSNESQKKGNYIRPSADFSAATLEARILNSASKFKRINSGIQNMPVD